MHLPKWVRWLWRAGSCPVVVSYRLEVQRGNEPSGPNKSVMTLRDAPRSGCQYASRTIHIGPGVFPLRQYSYIWSRRPPPTRGVRIAVLLGLAGILLYLWAADTTVELDPTLRYAVSLIERLLP